MYKISKIMQNVGSSRILSISNQVLSLKSQGRKIYDFTVGDYNTKDFKIPEDLRGSIIKHYLNGETNYPPAMGEKVLRDTLSEFIEDNYGMSYSTDEILVAGGARPLVYTTFKTLVSKDDWVMFTVPSWNYEYYTDLVEGIKISMQTRPSSDFHINRNNFIKFLDKASLIVLNYPSNPTGSGMLEEYLLPLCEAVVQANHDRLGKGNQKPIYLLYDMVYHLTSFNERLPLPTILCPELRPYTIYVDGISKCLASTGVRVGWAMGPKEIIKPMSNLLGHIGAWAAKPEQLGVADYLSRNNVESYQSFISSHTLAMFRRVDFVINYIRESMGDLPVDYKAPIGGMYLPISINIIGMTTPNMEVLSDSDAVFNYILNRSGVALIPFKGFGDTASPTWFRMSLGGVLEVEILEALSALKKCLEELVLYNR